MRCFISLDVSEEAKKEIARIEKEIQKSFPDLKARFVGPENMHLTLKFLGEISDEQVGKVKKALKKVKFEKFKARLNSLGVFTPSFIKIIWIDLEPKGRLLELHQQIDSLLHEEGIKKDKGFETHITLARVKSVRDGEALIRALRETKIKPVEFAVSGFSLRKSTLTPQGPIYEDILKL